MKAGIYKAHDGVLAYINTSKYVPATLPITPKYQGTVDTVLDKGNECLVTMLNGKQVSFKRIADVPAGRNNPGKVLAEYAATLDLVDTYRAKYPTPALLTQAQGRALRQPAADEESRLRFAGYRFCHAQSAAKHRKRGDRVIAVSPGRYAWKRDVLRDYQVIDEAHMPKGRRFVEWDAGAGKTGAR